MGLSVHGSRAKNLQRGKEIGISNSLSNATWVFLRELILSGVAGCRHQVTTAAEAKQDRREVLLCGFVEERMLRKLLKKGKMSEGGGRTYLRARWSGKPYRTFVTNFSLQKSEKHGEK